MGTSQPKNPKVYYIYIMKAATLRRLANQHVQHASDMHGLDFFTCRYVLNIKLYRLLDTYIHIYMFYNLRWILNVMRAVWPISSLSIMMSSFMHSKYLVPRFTPYP